MSQPTTTLASEPGKPKLLDQVRARYRVRHMALSTAEAYVAWIRKFILFHRVRHALEMGGPEVTAFLTHLAVEPLQRHLEGVRRAHEHALREGYGGVQLPYALAEKYPNADREWGWQYLYPADRPSRDPRSGAWRRHHLDESLLQKAVHAAVRKVGIRKHAGCHPFRHSFATHLLAAGTVKMAFGQRSTGARGIALGAGLYPSGTNRLVCADS